MAKNLWRVGLIVGLALILRILWLPENLFFGFEQGRDFLKLAEIARGDLVLIGPGTDIPGVFHGALSYYLPLPFFLIFGGNPFWVQAVFIFLNCLAIYPLYLAVKELFSHRVALVASIFYAVSYSSIIYSRWLSNPTLVPALTVGILFFLVWAKKNPWFLAPAALSWSIIFHLEIVAAITLFVPILAFVFLEKVEVNLRILTAVFCLILLILSPYVIFDFKNAHILTNGLRGYLSDPKSGVFDFRGSFDQFTNELTDSIYPLNRNVSLIIFWGAVITLLFSPVKKKENLLVLLFLLISPIAYLLYGMRPQRHFYVFTPIFISLALALFWDRMRSLKLRFIGLGILALVIFGNLWKYRLCVPESLENFIYHAQYMYFQDELELIDRVYQDSQGKPFSYDYYSIPYWKRESWDYLFNWYGKRKYGYLPSVEPSEIFYVFIEPDETQKPYQDEWYEKMNTRSIPIATYYSGKLRMEKRERR